MKAWKLAIFTILLSSAFATTPLIMDWVGLGFISNSIHNPLSDYVSPYEDTVKNSASSAESQSNSLTNDVSMFLIPLSILKLVLSIVWCLMTANYDLFQLAGIPTGIWSFYAIYHYITLTAFTVYIISGRQVEI
jgi:hypothetical protein